MAPTITDQLTQLLGEFSLHSARLASAKAIWALGDVSNQILISSARDGKAVSYYNDEAGRTVDLDPSDVQELVEHGLQHFCDSVSRLLAGPAEALRALVANEPAESIRCLLNMVADDKNCPTRIRQEAGEHLAYTLGQKAIPHILAASKEGDAYIRFHAVNILSKIGGPDAVDVIIAALSDPDMDVRRIAAVSLGRLGDRRAIGPLKLLLDTEVEPAVCESTRDALEKMGVSHANECHRNRLQQTPTRR